MYLGVLIPLLSVLLASQGVSISEKSSTQTESNRISNNLIFMNENGHEIQMGTDYAICSDIWEPGYIDEYSLKIFFYDLSSQASFWKLFFIVENIFVDTTYSFPTNESPFKMFLIDISNSNELSSNTTASSGNITITTFDCGPPIRVSFTINATIGSELGNGSSVHVSGDFSCTIHSNPAPFGCRFSM